jgi:hypothetical protein
MIRRFSPVVTALIFALATALPALAQESDPLAHSTLLPQAVGWAMAGLAVLLVILFILWTRRNPN